MDYISVIQSNLEWANRSFVNPNSGFEEFAWLMQDQGIFDEISAIRLSIKNPLVSTDLVTTHSETFSGHALIFTSSEDATTTRCAWIFEPVLARNMPNSETRSEMNRVDKFRNLLFKYHHLDSIGWNLEFSSPRMNLENVLSKGGMEVDRFSPTGEQVVYFPNNHQCPEVEPMLRYRQPSNETRRRVYFFPPLNLADLEFDLSLVPRG